jgi:hypothetical protein
LCMKNNTTASPCELTANGKFFFKDVPFILILSKSFIY